MINTLYLPELREMLAVQNVRLGEALESLQEDGRVRRTPTGWQSAIR